MAATPQMMSGGTVHAPFTFNEMACQAAHMINSRGFFYGFNTLQYPLPLLLIQMAGIILTARLLFHILKPLHQGIVSAHVIAGILLGPSMLGRSQTYLAKFLPIGGKVPLQTISNVGVILHLFLLGVRTDAGMIRKVGAKAIVIGLSSFVVPIIVGHLVLLALTHAYESPAKLNSSIHSSVVLNSMTSFPVITTILAELNILNSEVGRLSANASMVCEACSWVIGLIVSLRAQGTGAFWALAWDVTFMFVIVFVFRPLIIWTTERKTRKRDRKDEIPFFLILVVFLVTSLTSEVLGLHAAFGAFWLGVALPDGPPIGVALVKKLDTVATTLLLPVFIGISGLQTNFFAFKEEGAYVIETVILTTYVGKISGTFASALYCSMSFSEAFTLALIMCCQGVVQIATSIMLNDAKILTAACFNLTVITFLLVSGVARPLIVYLYDPSERYRTKSKRTILHSGQRNFQLRLLVCVYSADDVPTIVNLLEASNPTRFSPISIFTLHLMDLKGRAQSILVPHHQLTKLDPNAQRSEKIVSAFQRFEQQHPGTVMAQHFTAIAPYTSMHDDVCTLALDKKATIVIVPFHKHYAIDGTVGSVNPAIRNINQNVLDKAPCSVGILIDRGQIAGNRSVLTGLMMYNVALLFLGGADDLEALAYCIRMAEHPNVTVTLIDLKNKDSDDERGNSMEKQMLNEFRAHCSSLTQGNAIYREEIVKSGVDTTQVISSLEDDYDLVIVGREHDMDSPILLGLTEWSECPELGVVGDLLTTPDFHFSVLVVHQQSGDFSSVDNGYELSISSPKSGDSRVYSRYSEAELTTIQIGKGANK